MKIEQINENTIKVMIGKSDLEARGVTFFDLLGSQKKVESFFYSILDEVGARHEFEGIEAVTFQVVPKTDGLDLYITKGMNDNMTEHLKTALESMDSTNNTPLDQMIHVFENEITDRKEDTAKNKQKRQTQLTIQVFVFNHINDFIAFANQMTLDIGDNTLYFYEDHYYWSHKPQSIQQMNNIRYKALEYAELTPISDVYLTEHGKHIMETSAIDMIKTYFT